MSAVVRKSHLSKKLLPCHLKEVRLNTLLDLHRRYTSFATWIPLMAFFTLLLIGGPVTAQVPANATAEELKKIKDDATARSATYLELTKADNARKAWEASQDPSKQAVSDQSAAVTAAKDLADMQKAQAEAEKAKAEAIQAASNQSIATKAAKELAEARKAQADAEKAQADAELAAAKAKFGEIPSSGYTGAVEVGTGAGGAEAMLLGSVAVNEIANNFTEVIKRDQPQGLTKLLLFTTQTAPDFQALLAFNTQFDALKYAIDEAKKSTEDVERPKAAGVVALGLGLEAINKLLAFFKTDYKFQHVEVETSDSMLLTALAGKLGSKNIKVELPSLFFPAALANASTVLDQTTKLYNSGLDARQRVLDYESTQGEIEKQLAAKPDDETLKQKLQKVKEAVGIWKTLADRIDGWAKQSAGADDKGNVPLATIIRQAAIKNELDAGAGFVVVQLYKVGGTTYTKKNLVSSIGGNPFYVMGGAVASLTAFNGKDGQVFASALVPWHGGYLSVSDIQSVVNQQAP